jgi:long-subunit fatty acid transport protein
MGLGYNRIRSFEDRFHYTGTADSSIIHSFIKEANGTNDSLIFDAFPFGAGLAYDVYAMDPHPTVPNSYTTAFSSGQAVHNREVIRKGGMAEYNFSMSGNYGNKLFVGGSLNATRVRYSEDFTHRETYTGADSLWLNSTQYTGSLDIKGWGYNVRAGLIFLPTDWIRIGLAAQTPTYYVLKDFWTNNMSANTDDPEIPNKTVSPEFVPTGSYDYRLRTPFKANASLGLVLKKVASIGAEVEYVDYAGSSLSSKRFSSAPYAFTVENQQIDNLYRSVFNVKAGVEARINPQTYVRGGFAYYPSPYKSSSGNVQYPTTFYTGGLGYNFGSFYVDAAFVLKKLQQDYYAYDPTLSGSRALIDVKNSQYLLTLGFRIK